MKRQKLNINEIEKVAGGKVVEVSVRVDRRPSPEEEAFARLVALAKLSEEERRRRLANHPELAAAYEIYRKKQIYEIYNGN